MASVTTDKRNGRVVVRAYAGIDPRTRKKRWLRESLAPGSPDAAVAAACDRLDERARFMKETGEELTLDGLVSWYIAELRHARRPIGTLKTYKSYYYRHISPRRGGVPADEVRPFMISRDLAAAVEGIDRDPISPRTANCVRSLLHAAYAAGMADGVVDRNPVAAVMRMDEDDSDYVRVFDERELSVLSAWIDSPSEGWPEACAKAAASIALGTGMRVGEVCALRPRDVDVARRRAIVAGTLTEAGGLHRKGTKGKRHRTVALDAETAARAAVWKSAVLDRFGSCETLFPDHLGKLTAPSTISRIFGDACRDLGLGDGRRFHELRHTHATWLLEKGESPKTVAERLGDASDAFVLATYGHVLPGRDAMAAERFGELRTSIHPRKEGGAPYGK